MPFIFGDSVIITQKGFYYGVMGVVVDIYHGYENPDTYIVKLTYDREVAFEESELTK